MGILGNLFSQAKTESSVKVKQVFYLIPIVGDVTAISKDVKHLLHGDQPSFVDSSPGPAVYEMKKKGIKADASGNGIIWVDKEDSDEADSIAQDWSNWSW